MTGAAAVPVGTHHAPHPAIKAAHATIQPMGAPIATFAMTYPTGIVTPHTTDTPLLLPTLLTPLFQGPVLVSLQQLSLHGIGSTADEESQDTP